MKARSLRLLAALMCVLMLFAVPAVWAEDDPAGDTPIDVDIPADGGDPADGDIPAGAQDTGSNAEDVTKKLKVKLSEGKATNLADRKKNTAWAPKKNGASMQLTVPSGRSVAMLALEWTKNPAAFTLTEYDSDGNTLSTRDQSDTYVGLQHWFPLNAQTSRILLELPQKGESLAEVYVFTSGTLPSTIHTWEAPVEQAELMVLAAHMGDEFLYMGGAIPYYRDVEGRSVQVVYVVNDGRQSQDEALNALWAAGVRNYPEFLNFPDKASMSLTETISGWGGEEKPIGLIVEAIRKYKPDVIISNSAKGEKGDGARMAVADCVKKAVEAAADETKYPESVSKYGAWETKKLYLHLDEEKPVTLDWQTAYDELDGQTPLAVAKAGYENYKTLKAFNPLSEGGEYDNAKFGLVYTTVGDDAIGEDFFEHVSLEPDEVDLQDPDVNWADKADIEAAQGELTPPTVTPTPEPTPSPTPEPTPVPAGFQIRENLEPLKTFGIVLGSAIVLIGLGAGVRFLMRKYGYTFNFSEAFGRQGKKKKKGAAKKSGAVKKAQGAKKKTSGAKKMDDNPPPEDEVF